MGSAIKATGAWWTWGWNGYGQLGDNTQNDRSSPVLVVGNHSFTEAYAGYYWTGKYHARKANGEVWSCGNSFYGGLGDDTTVSKSSPVLVVGNHSFTGIGCSHAVSSGCKANGELWSWGSDYYGSLGRDTSGVNKSSPVLVVGNHSFVDPTAGYEHCVARKANGQIWTWGPNGQGEIGGIGQIGDNEQENRSSPVLVVGNHSFVERAGGLARSSGRKDNGEVWNWGMNWGGELGDNTIDCRLSPVLVVGNHSFVELTDSDSVSYGRKGSGEVWSWGQNSVGELGDNTNDYRSSPVLVVGNHSFVEVMYSSYAVHARKSNGEVWSWGGNDSGLLGDNTTVAKSSPVLVVGSHSFATLSFLEGETEVIRPMPTFFRV